MAETLEFDPASEASGSPLTITTGSYLLLEHKYPTPPLSAQWASSVDTEGASLASKKHENREIQITVDVTSSTALATLQAKIGKLYREGGTLKRTLPSGLTIIFDVKTVANFDPSFDHKFDVGGWSTVPFTLICKPYGRGAAVTLTDHTETTLPALTFTETGIKGDVPALGRLVIDGDQAGVIQHTLIWGVESRDLTASMPPFVEAENTTYVNPTSGSTTVADPGPAGASGAGANKTLKMTLAASEPLLPYVEGAFTSIGTFNVYARVQAPVANAGNASIRMAYGNIGAPGLVYGDSITLDSAFDGSWILVKLGQVTARKQLLTATGNWRLFLTGKSTTGGDLVYWDYLMIVPVAEGAGEMYASVLDSGSATSGGVILTHNDIQRYGYAFSTAYAGFDRPEQYSGDYLLVPPAGAEARSARFFVKLSRGGIQDSSSDTATNADSAIDDVSARLTYTPRYLVIPAP